MSRNIGYDRHITIFSPEGRLYQIQYAFKAAKSSGLTSVGVAGNDCVVFCIQKKVPDKMIVPQSVSHLFTVSQNIGACMTGLLPDGRALISRLRQQAADFRFQNGFFTPVHVLANRAADMAQVYTQKAFQRPYGVITMLGAIDDQRGPQLFKVDPAGMFQGYKATAAGVKEQEAINYLEKQFKKAGGNFPRDAAIELAIECLQQVTSQEYKATDLEVAVIGGETTGLVQMSTQEIDDRLNIIAAKDQ